MSSNMTFSLRGSAEMERHLRLLRDGVAEKVVKRSLRAAARPIVSAARRNAKRTTAIRGKRYGGLSRSIGVVVRNYKATHKVLAVIGPRHGTVVMREGKREAPALIAHLVEFGHRIAVSGSLATLPGRKSRGTRKRRGVEGGYVKAQPFLRPAFDAQRGAAQQKLENELRIGIEREASKG